MKFHFQSLLFLSFIALTTANAQNSLRTAEYNAIGWYNYFGTFKVADRWSIHTEYQWRRSHWISHWQQSLLRIGINYHFHAKATLRIGYGWIETFPYSQTPINAFGKDFTEHRIFQALILTDKIGRVDFSHRFKLEQRWIGFYNTPLSASEDTYRLLHRFRYMFRGQIALKQNVENSQIPYIAFYDELFVGFGENVGENILDQNRIGVLIGYQFNPYIKLEAGYLNQTLQLAREVNNKNVWQYNNGLIINAIFQADWRKKEK